MKIVDFIRYLRTHRCVFLGEGGNHSVYINTVNNRISTVPRHKEIKNKLCMKICKDLGIPSPF